MFRPGEHQTGIVGLQLSFTAQDKKLFQYSEEILRSDNFEKLERRKIRKGHFTTQQCYACQGLFLFTEKRNKL